MCHTHASITLSARRKMFNWTKVNQKTPDTQVTINSSSRVILAASIPHTKVYIFDTERNQWGLWSRGLLRAAALALLWVYSRAPSTRIPPHATPHPSLCLEEQTRGSWWNSAQSTTRSPGIQSTAWNNTSPHRITFTDPVHHPSWTTDPRKREDLIFSYL